MKFAFKAAYILAIPWVFFTLMSGLPAPMLLGIGVLFSVPALLSIRSPRLHWMSVGISAASLSALMLFSFVPVWVAAAGATTPGDHLRVGEAYALRGQLFGSDGKTWEHYLIAAKGGDAEAQSRVGTAYIMRHYGVPLDREQAKFWLTAAAQQGHTSATQLLKSVDTSP